MSGDPMSAGLPAGSPGLSLAEQFGSFADYAVSTEATPRPASTSLDVARFHAYTGEVSFSTDPLVRLYLDGGTVYHAEREGDPPISRVLRDLGIVEADQLERGMVRVGDVEHLGRLFDREPSIDRDAVMVVMETRTEAIVRELANRATASVNISAYRHHPSGIHRWFVVSHDPAGSQRPVSAVAQVDRSVVDELPALRAAPPTLEIEWSDPDPSGPLPTPMPAPVGLDAGVGRVDADRAGTSDDDPAWITPLSEFHIVWPDGTADEAIGPSFAPSPPSPPSTPSVSAALPPPAPAEAFAPAPAPLTAPPVDPSVAPPAGSIVAASVDPSDAVPPVIAAVAPSAPAPAVVADAGPSFSIAPLQIDALPEPDAAVPDEVAAAVKRALQAIEGASTGRVSVPELAVMPISLPELRLPTAVESVPAAEAPIPTAAAAPAAPAVAPPQSAPLGFAPPTADMRAEAVYERAAAAARGAADSAFEAPLDEESASHPGPGRASVVFVDDDPEPAAERRGALRRLIGSLRHKDD
jgi:hypothetical protein